VASHLPVLGFTLQHEGILRLADFSSIIILNLLHIELGLHAVILGKGALVSLL
jgi:hypothetical protein